MLLKLFKSNHPYVLFLTPLLAILLWLPAFNNAWGHTLIDFSENQSYLFNLIYGSIDHNPGLLSFLGLALCVIQSYIIIRLNFKYIFVESRSYLPAVMFIIFSSFLGEYQSLHPALFSFTFFLFAINKALDVSNERKIIKNYFEAGFWLGVGGLFYNQAIYFIVIVWISLIVINGFNWRAFITSAVGYVVPLLMGASLLFITDSLSEINTYIANFSKVNTDYTATNTLLMSASAMGFLYLYVLLSNARTAGTKKISTRKYMILFFLMLIYYGVLFASVPSISYDLLPAVAFPSAILFTTFFMQNRKKWINEVLFTLIILITLYNLWF